MQYSLSRNMKITKSFPLWSTTAIGISVEKAVGLPFCERNEVKFGGQHFKLRELLIKFNRGSLS